MGLFQIPDTFPLYWPLPNLQFRKRIKTTKGAGSFQTFFTEHLCFIHLYLGLGVLPCLSRHTPL